MDSPRIIKLSPFDLYGIRKVYIRIHSAVTHLWLSVRWWNFKFPSSIPRKSCPSRKADKGTGHKPAGMYLYLYLSLLRRMLRMLNPKLGMMPPLSVLFLVSLNFSWFFMCLSAERKLSSLSSHFPHFSPEFSHRISERWPPSNLRLSGGIRNGTKMTFANGRRICSWCSRWATIVVRLSNYSFITTLPDGKLGWLRDGATNSQSSMNHSTTQRRRTDTAK